MPFLRIEIVRFVDEHQPGIVAGEFTDAQGTQHTIIDKVPMIAMTDLWSDSTYPQPGFAACEILDQSQDAQGRRIVQITIDKPWGLQSVDGETQFVVLASQVTDELDNC